MPPWHVQDAGQGDVALLIHGAGGSLHSFADLIPPLAKTHRTIAIDLPGQGFTQLGARSRCGLTPMTQDIEKLLRPQNHRDKRRPRQLPRPRGRAIPSLGKAPNAQPLYTGAFCVFLLSPEACG